MTIAEHDVPSKEAASNLARHLPQSRNVAAPHIMP